MNTQPRAPFPKTFACRWLIAFLLHALVLDVLAGSGTVSALFSPGAHLANTTILVAGIFVVLRVYVMLLGPAAIISLLAWLYLNRRRLCAPRHPRCSARTASRSRAACDRVT